MNGEKILIVEDEQHILEGIKFNLEKEGYQVFEANEGEAGLRLFFEQSFDLVILDIMLPKLDGHQVLKAIRSQNEKIPVLILSAKDSKREKVLSFSEGVDDYVTKPFDLEEFLARIQKLLKKATWYGGQELPSNGHADKIFSFGENKVDFFLHKAFCGTTEVDLTQQELKLLKVFFENPEIPLTRAQLLEMAWGYADFTNTRTLDNFIVRLRKYFEKDPRNSQHFVGIRNVGYIFYP